MKYGWIFLLISGWAGGQDIEELEDAGAEVNQYLGLHKLDINQCTKAELEQVLFLSFAQIKELLDYRSVHSFQSIFELQTLPSWDLPTCRKLLPYLSLILPEKTEEVDWKFIYRTNTSLEQKKGFSPPTKTSKTRYLGDPWGHYLRAHAQEKEEWALGLTIQKDPGEKDFWDFYSGFFHWKGKNKEGIIGDFTNLWGQGLILSGGFFLGKSYQSIRSTQKLSLTARPYTSSGEANFSRGIYFTQELNHGKLEIFGAYNPLDATLVEEEDKVYFTTIYTDGFHRTASELKRRKAVQEWVGALNYSYFGRGYSWGLSGMYQGFNPGKLPSTKAYQARNWSGNELWNFSFTYEIQPGANRWVGEWALGNGSLAMVNGLIHSLSNKWFFSHLIRYYQTGYTALMANGFRESTETSNEIGYYFGQEWMISKYKKFWLYQDVFWFPYFKYEVSQKNSWGWEGLARMQWNKKSFSQFKYLSKQVDGAKELERTHHFQLIQDHYWERKFKLKMHARAILNLIQKPGQMDKGFSFFIDFQRKWRNIKWISRVWYFNTDNYDSRTYAYEPGLLYQFSIPAVYDKGYRLVAIVEKNFGKHLSLGLKISRTHYFNRTSIGSSYEEITGPNKTDLNFQLIRK